MNNKNIRTVLLIGGHLSPAQATAEALKKRDASVELVFIGRQKALSTDTEVSVEDEVMKQCGCDVYTIPAIRLSVTIPSTWFVFFSSLLHSFRLLRKTKPDIIISFGGYVSVPVVLIAFLLRLPIVMHEQTQILGKANALLGRFAKKIYVSFADTSGAHKQKYEYVGFPLRSHILAPPRECPLPIVSSKPLLFITGGTTGAVSMNDLLFPLILELTEQYMIVHQTGYQSLKKAQKVKDSLPAEVSDLYLPVAYIESSYVSWLLHHAHIVISRSGANTVWELAVIGVPALLFPLPWSADDEQKKNAAWLSSLNGSTVLNQEKSTSPIILAEIRKLEEQYELYKKRAEKAKATVPTGGADALAQKIL